MCLSVYVCERKGAWSIHRRLQQTGPPEGHRIKALKQQIVLFSSTVTLTYQALPPLCSCHTECAEGSQGRTLRMAVKTSRKEGEIYRPRSTEASPSPSLRARFSSCSPPVALTLFIWGLYGIVMSGICLYSLRYAGWSGTDIPLLKTHPLPVTFLGESHDP